MVSSEPLSQQSKKQSQGSEEDAAQLTSKLSDFCSGFLFQQSPTIYAVLHARPIMADRFPMNCLVNIPFRNFTCFSTDQQASLSLFLSRLTSYCTSEKLLTIGALREHLNAIQSISPELALARHLELPPTTVQFYYKQIVAIPPYLQTIAAEYLALYRALHSERPLGIKSAALYERDWLPLSQLATFGVLRKNHKLGISEVIHF
jgi:hypothetical protein